MVYFLALASAALYGAADFLGGMASRRASTPVVVFVSQGVGLVLLAALLPFMPAATPAPADFGWGAVAGLAGGAGVGLLYRALAIGTMAVVAPVTAVCAVVLPVVVGVLTGDRLLPMTTAGILTALVAIALVSRQTRTDTDRDSGSLPRGVPLAFASGVAIGLFFLALARTSATAGLWPLLSSRVVSVTIFGVAVLRARTALAIPPGSAPVMASAGALDMLANALYLVATRGGALPVVVTLASLYPASTVLLARVVAGERLSGWQVLGVGCAVAAVVMIVAAP